MNKPTTIRSGALALLAVLALGACNRDWDTSRTEDIGAGSPATASGTIMAHAKGMGRLQGQGLHASQVGDAAEARAGFAALPDRGDLVGYPQERVVRREGAYTWHRVDVSEEHALRAIVDGELRITAPNGEVLAFEYERHVEHPTGDWTWIGRLREAPPGRQAILTFGADAVYGSIAQIVSEPLSLAMRDGASWLMETDPALLADVEGRVLRPEEPDFLVPPLYFDNAAAPRASGGTEPVGASGGDVESSSSTTSSSTTVVDVLVGYTPGFATYHGGDSQARTRINFLVDVANQGYVNSQIDARVRLVHAMEVNYPDATDNGDTLEKLTGYKSGEGQTTPDPAFSALRNARETYGADLVTLVRKFTDPENDGCGIAWLIGGGLTNITQGYEFFGYSVVGDGIDQGDDGKNYTCREETMAHEWGHNMGSAHDVETAKGEDGVLDNPDDYGRYTYSFGYRTGAGTGDFYTIMAYREKRDSGTQQQPYRVFSNPDITYCGGFPCGTSNADNARSLRQTMPIIADFRATAVSDPPAFEVGNGVMLKQLDVNGDARSDLFFFNHATNRISVWFMRGYTRIASSSSNISGNYRVVDSGDLDGDKRSDLLLTSAARDVVVGVSNGISFTFSLLPLSYSSNQRLEGLADVNGDGKSDILVRRTDTGALTVWYMNGLSRYAYNTHSVGAGLQYVGSGDLNGDSKQDLLWVDSQRNVFASISSGTQFSTTYTGLTHSSSYKLYGLQDVNGDGKSDMVLLSESLNRLVVWYMNGTTRYAYNGHTATPGFRLMGKGDFDGNRRGDLVFQNPSTRQIRYMLSAGSYFAKALSADVPQSGTWLMDME